MDSYYLLLYVTIEKENAIRMLFKQRGWSFLKSDIQCLQQDGESYAQFSPIYFTQELGDEQTSKTLVQRKQWQLQQMQFLNASEKYMKNEEKSHENEEFYIATKVENFITNRGKNYTTNNVENNSTNSIENRIINKVENTMNKVKKDNTNRFENNSSQIVENNTSNKVENGFENSPTNKVENNSTNRLENIHEKSNVMITNETYDNSNVDKDTTSSEFQEDINHTMKHDDNGFEKHKADHENNEEHSAVSCENIDNKFAVPDTHNERQNIENDRLQFEIINRHNKEKNIKNNKLQFDVPNGYNEGQNTLKDELQFEVKENKNLNNGNKLSTNETEMHDSDAYIRRKIEKGKNPMKKRRKEQEQIKEENMPGIVNQQEGRKNKGYVAKKQPVHCDECDVTFTSMKRFESHKAKNGGQCVFTCEYCGKIFKYRKSKYIIHVRAAHTKERPHTCDLCGKGFVTSDKLKIHKRSHTNERPCVCEQCGKSFYSRANLSTHKHYHHTTPENVGDLKCDICDVTFCSKRYLLYHKNVTHSETRDFLCSQCDKSFKSNRALKQHFKVMHTEDQDYKCKICDKTFKTSAYLRKHMFCHTSERNFQCSYCEKAFYTKTKLTLHERTHTGVKPYKCDLCGYRCALSGNLIKHKNTHYRRHPNTLISTLKSNNQKD